MEKKDNAKKKNWLSRWIEKLDKKMGEKAKKCSCRSPKDKQKGDSCCG